MTKVQEKTELGHHALAAMHHERAARYHQAASDHFKSGKDYAHSSHQANLARGHSLRALDLARKARSAAPAISLPPAGQGTQSTQRIEPDASPEWRNDTMGSNPAEQHRMAAVHSQKAALHERQASSLELVSDFRGALRAAAIADSHAQRALNHSDEAAMYLATDPALES